MSYAFSKAFGPTDSVAGTKTAIGSTYVIRPGNYTIQRLYVSKGNVVNAKEIAGVVIVEITGVDGTYEYAYGNGAGAATIGIFGPREKIDCRIPAPGGATITVSITDAEAATACVVSADFFNGMGERIDSYSAGGSGIDPAAATLKEIGTMTVTRAGRIKQIRYATGSVVNGKSASAKLELEIPGVAGPFEYSVGNGPGGATSGGAAAADIFDIDIPVGVNTIITANVTYTDAAVSATISLQVQ